MPTKEKTKQEEIVYIWGKCLDCRGDIWVEPKNKDIPHLCTICGALREGVDVEAVSNVS